jgi:hypothetical protein
VAGFGIEQSTTVKNFVKFSDVFSPYHLIACEYVHNQATIKQTLLHRPMSHGGILDVIKKIVFS